jgi:hypothetical protein
VSDRLRSRVKGRVTEIRFMGEGRVTLEEVRVLYYESGDPG